MKLLIFSLMLSARAVHAVPTYLECSPYKASIKSAAEEYIQNIPHYSSGYQYQQISVLQDLWHGRMVCTISYSRNTDSCDDYLYRNIYVDPLSGEIVDDVYTNSAWCGY